MSESKQNKDSVKTKYHEHIVINENVGDYRTRWNLPDNWISSLRHGDLFGMEYVGYISIIMDALRKHLPISTDSGKSPLVFDIGCGDGRVSYEMATAGYRVSGFDYNQRALGFARVYNPESTFKVADLTSEEVIPFHDGEESPQAIVMVEVLEHIHPKHYPNVLGRLHSIIAPNGRFVISVPSKDLPLNEPWHYLHFSEEDFQTVLEENGWNIEERIYNHRLAHPISWFMQYGWRYIDNRLWRFHFLCGWFAKRYMRCCNICKANQKPGRFIFVCKPSSQG